MKRCVAAAGAVCATLIAVSAGFSACSHGTHGGHGEMDLDVSFDGPWQGTWVASSGGSGLASVGTLTLQLDQSGSAVTGTAEFTGHPCLTTCTVSCQVNGHGFSGWFQAGPAQMPFSGLCPESNHCSGPHHANLLSAGYEIQDGPCAGESGAIQMTPTSGHGSGATEGGAVQVGELILIDLSEGSADRLPVFQPTEGAR